MQESQIISVSDATASTSTSIGLHRARLLYELPEDALATTREAATMCGFKTPSALRKAFLEGRIRPFCKRGGRGTWMWRVHDLRRFVGGLPPLPDVAGDR